MKVKANISFCGTISMAKNEVKDIPEGGVLSDLLAAGYVTEQGEVFTAIAPGLAAEVKVNENKRGKSKSD